MIVLWGGQLNDGSSFKLFPLTEIHLNYEAAKMIRYDIEKLRGFLL